MKFGQPPRLAWRIYEADAIGIVHEASEEELKTVPSITNITHDDVRRVFNKWKETKYQEQLQGCK